jgi:hypothetical protein
VAFATLHRKPFIVGETASLGSDPATPAWITAYGAWAALHPAVKAVNFFDSISPKGNDFRLIAYPALLAAFTTLGNESDMQAMP